METKIRVAAITALLALSMMTVGSSFSLMPVSHAQSEQVVTWNFHGEIVFGTVTSGPGVWPPTVNPIPKTTLSQPIVITYGFKVQNGTKDVNWYNAQNNTWTVLQVPKYSVVESKTVIDNVSDFSFSATMSVTCTSGVIAFISPGLSVSYSSCISSSLHSQAIYSPASPQFSEYIG